MCQWRGEGCVNLMAACDQEGRGLKGCGQCLLLYMIPR